ncbi:hypothetical protein PMI16_00428 [Herbaspirillum sp. CF444]|uniref:hypothetical protein n=1 Tax=Herbaspirillum sp. CF444 TaxID=1144319 RepID=UPI0002726869|nr:hypothetical protein [Herbaspirillum sp. CF444]EJL94073.1 hypothetical protein PMI16_00428 [Herbaspirillum sp. CF444]
MAAPNFEDFRRGLQGIDEPDAEKMLAAKTEMMQRLYQRLSASEPTAVLAFGQELHAAMRRHDESDTLDRAHGENRAIFRSWHKAGAVDEIDLPGADADHPEKVRAHVGFDALNVLLDPAAFRGHKAAYQARAEGVYPTIETPATLLQRGDKTPSVFNDEHGTVTALLPEEHYAAFFAFNAVAKEMNRKQAAAPSAVDGVAAAAPGRHEVDALAAHAKGMRASVTRPVFFDFEDIGSYTHPLADADAAKPPHVRKGHFEEPAEPKLHASFDEKIQDARRVKAVFYQSFNESVPIQRRERQGEWNEMVVKFRATGHTAPMAPDMAELVPALQGRKPPAIAPTMTAARPDRSSTKTVSSIRAPERH